MSKPFWKKILSAVGLVLFLSFIGIEALILMMNLTRHADANGFLVGVIEALIYAIGLTIIVMIPYAFYVFGTLSRGTNSDMDPSTHTAFRNPVNTSTNHSSHIPEYMSVPDIFEKAWVAYKANLKKMWALYILGGLGAALSITICLNEAFGWSLVAAQDPEKLFWVPVVVAFGLIVAFLLLWSKIAFIRAILDSRKGQYTGAIASYGKVKSVYWSFFFVAVLAYLAEYGAFIFLIIPAIAIAGCLMFSGLVVLDKGKKGFAALTESWSLVSGRWWITVLRIVAIFIVLELFSMIVLLVTMIIIGIPLVLLLIGAVGTFGSVAYVLIFIFGLVFIVIVWIVAVMLRSFLTFAFIELYSSLTAVRAAEPAEPVSSEKNRKIILKIAIVIYIIAFIPLIYLGIRFGNWVKAKEVTLAAEQAQQMNNMQMMTGSAAADESMEGMSATSTDLQAQPYVGANRLFQISLPVGWTVNSDSQGQSPALMEVATFSSNDNEAAVSVGTLNADLIRQTLSTSTDAEIASTLAGVSVKSIEDGLTQDGFGSFQLTQLIKLPFGKDAKYVYSGSATDNTQTVFDFQVIIIFNGEDAYQILADWPEAEYGDSGDIIGNSLNTFKILNQI